MKKLLFCLTFLTITLFTNAQTETTNWLYNLEGKTPATPKIVEQNNTTTLKMLNTKRHFDENFLLGETLKNAINKGELTIYQDKKCKTAFTKAAAKSVILYLQIDTIITFDAETFEEKIKVIRLEKPFFPTEEIVYELEQSWEYDKKSNQVNMNLTAIHVYYLEIYDNGNVADLTKRKYLFSIKNEDAKALIPSKELEKMSVIWAKEFSYNGTFENKNLRETLLSENHQNAHKVVGSGDRSYILSANELKQLCQTNTGTDTIITFNPETFEEKMTIVNTQQYFDAEHITTFRIVQDFYFDTETNTFKTRILAIAPLMKIFNDNGDFVYQYPLFWIVYEDDFMKTFD